MKVRGDRVDNPLSLMWNQEVMEDLFHYPKLTQLKIINQIKKELLIGARDGIAIVENMENHDYLIYKKKVFKGTWVTYSISENKKQITILSISDCLRDKKAGSMNALERIEFLQQSVEAEMKKIRKLVGT